MTQAKRALGHEARKAVSFESSMVQMFGEVTGSLPSLINGIGREVKTMQHVQDNGGPAVMTDLGDDAFWQLAWDLGEKLRGLARLQEMKRQLAMERGAAHGAAAAGHAANWHRCLRG